MNRKNPLMCAEAIQNHTGRLIKHPALISGESIPGANELAKKAMELFGTDIESDHETGEIHLMGFHDGKKYWFYEQNFLQALLQIVEYYEYRGASMVNWSRYDPAQVFRLFLTGLPLSDQYLAIRCHGNISGDFDKKACDWREKPIIERDMGNGKLFGVSSVIRSNIQLSIRQRGEENLGTLWLYNIAPFYQENLEKTGKKYLPWYSKLQQRDHLLDAAAWERFHHPKTAEDKAFRVEVLLSNEYDSRAAQALGVKVLEDFAKVFFGKYPKNLISTGSLTRAAIAAYAEYANREVQGPDFRKKVADDLQSIGIAYHEPSWRAQLGDERFKKFIHACYAVYKGAIIECYGYGHFDSAWTADLHAAYVASEINIPDLRGSVVDMGEGEPPEQPFRGFVFCEGTVDVPKEAQHHTLLIRNPVHPEGNLRPYGRFRTFYFKEERDHAVSIGVRFSDEKWYRVTTTGRLSILAEAAKWCQEDRIRRQEAGDPNYIRSKQVVLGIYGDLFEGVPVHRLTPEGKIVFDGIRAGKYLMPLVAGWVTMQTKVKICKASIAIEKAGGKPIFSQTDSMTWLGKKSDMPAEMCANKPKIVGKFDGPEEIRDLISLGAGRYEYSKLNKDTGEWDAWTAKSRGFFLDKIEKEDGVLLEDVSWRDCLQHLVVDENGKQKIALLQKVLVTPGLVVSNHKLEPSDIGRIMDPKDKRLKEQEPEKWQALRKLVDPISGKNKRKIDRLRDLSLLASSHVWSEPIPVWDGLLVGQGMIDDTLPELKEELMKKDLAPDKKKRTRAREEDEKRGYRERYFLLRKYGFDVATSKSKASGTWDQVLDYVHTTKATA